MGLSRGEVLSGNQTISHLRAGTVLCIAAKKASGVAEVKGDLGKQGIDMRQAGTATIASCPMFGVLVEFGSTVNPLL